MSTAAESAPTELATILQINKPTELFVAGGLDPFIQGVTKKAEAEATGLDISFPQDREKIASIAYGVAQYKNHAEKTGKAYKESITQMVPVIDAERKRCWNALQALQDRIRAPLTEWETKDKIRVEKFETDIATMIAMRSFVGTPSSELVQSRLEDLYKWKGREWEEFYDRAKTAFSATAMTLINMLEELKKAEVEAAELARFRAEEAERKQRERDEQIAREATEQAKNKAEADAAEAIEKMARERKAAEDRAYAAELRQKAEKQAADERGRKAAIAQATALKEANERAAKQQAESIAAAARANAKAKADQEAAVQRERDRVAKEAKAQADAQAKREANKKHREKIHRAIFDAIAQELTTLKSDDMDGDRAQLIMESIAHGRIPHVSITY